MLMLPMLNLMFGHFLWRMMVLSYVTYYRLSCGLFCYINYMLRAHSRMITASKRLSTVRKNRAQPAPSTHDYLRVTAVSRVNARPHTVRPIIISGFGI